MMTWLTTKIKNNFISTQMPLGLNLKNKNKNAVKTKNKTNKTQLKEDAKLRENPK